MRKLIMESEAILLYLTEASDLDKILEIEQDKDNKYFVYHWTKDQHYEKIIAKDWMHILILKRNTQEIIGYILLDGIHNAHKTIELTRIVIKEKGKGYGKQALKMIKKLCFQHLNCHRLWLDVFEDNKNAINLYTKEGFTYEGTLRECKKIKDNYHSMCIMSILEHEYIE